MPAKILVADDDEALRSAVKKYLVSEGFAVLSAQDGSDALLLIREGQPDLALLDADMPGLDGFKLCRILKSDAALRNIAVVIMSGKLIQDKDFLSGFEGGADDYVTKPFSPRVLAARLEAVLRRYKNPPKKENLLKKCGLRLDPGARTVMRDGKVLPLTRKEFDLLSILIEKSGRLLSIPYLLETVWGYDPADYNDPGTVEVHISHLRKKLGPKIGTAIVNVLGHGYRFDERFGRTGPLQRRAAEAAD